MIPLKDQEYIRQRFEQELAGRVRLDYFTQKASAIFVPGREECATCEDTQQVVEEIASLSDKVSLTVHDFADTQDEARKLGVEMVPGIVLRGPANRALRFFGMPAGNEFPNFIETMIESSKQKVELAPEVSKHLKRLKDDVAVTVYVTPTCPYCPGVVRAAYRLALASVHVKASAVEISEFARLGQQLGIRAVPTTVINGRSTISGAMDELALAEHISNAAGGAVTELTGAGATSVAAQPSGAPPVGGLILPR